MESEVAAAIEEAAAEPEISADSAVEPEVASVPAEAAVEPEVASFPTDAVLEREVAFVPAGAAVERALSLLLVAPVDVHIAPSPSVAFEGLAKIANPLSVHLSVARRRTCALS